MAGNFLSPALPVLHTTGSYYEVGYSVGSFFANSIKHYFQTSKQVQDIFLPYMATDNGKRFREEAYTVCKDNFPEHIREIQGMADGSGLSFNDIFLINIRKEIRNVLVFEEKTQPKPNSCEGCTDIGVNNPHTKLWAHNEDYYPVMVSHAYLVNARVVEDGKEIEHYTAFCTPGALPGNAFASNRHGMVFTVNEVFVDFVVHNAPPQLVLNRAVIKAHNIDEAVAILRNKGYGSAYGFCSNICDIKYPSKMWSIEIAPQADESIIHVQTINEERDPERPCHYIHVNGYDHLPYVSTKDSEARKQRANEMKAPRILEDMLAILGDTADKSYPIYRTPRPTDDYQTLVTAVAHILENRMDIYMGNPAVDGAVPLVQYKIKDGD